MGYIFQMMILRLMDHNSPFCILSGTLYKLRVKPDSVSLFRMDTGDRHLECYR